MHIVKKGGQRAVETQSQRASRVAAWGRVGATVCLLGLPLGMASSAQAQNALISEFRLRGINQSTNPNDQDEIVEIYNNTDDNLVLTGYRVEYTATSGSGVITIPAVTLPPRGHYLIGGARYSLNSYAIRDQIIQAAAGDIADGSTLTLRPGIGATPDDVVSVGATPTGPTNTVQYSYVRRTSPSDSSGKTLVDTGSASDFALVSVGAAVPAGSPTTTPVLGTPGPQNLSGGANGFGGVTVPANPVVRNEDIPVALFAPSQSINAEPNRVRLGSSQNAFVSPNANNTNATFGTIKFRRTITNNTGEPITTLRFRAIAITTRNNTTSADVRLLSSNDESAGGITTSGVTLQAVQATPQGGGLNSSVADLDVTGSASISPLAPGNTRSYNFVLGVVSTGSFSIRLDVEALPTP